MKSIKFPGKNRIIFETAEDGVTQWKKKNLKEYEKNKKWNNVTKDALFKLD